MGPRPVLKFSRDWPKLDAPIFTTIRKSHAPYEADEGTVFDVETPTRRFTAVLLFNTGSSIEDLSTDLLCYDTDTKTREEALAVLNGFYRNPPTVIQFMLLRKLVVA